MGDEIRITVIATGFEDVIGKRPVRKDGEAEEPAESEPEEAEPEEMPERPGYGLRLGGDETYNPNNDFPIPSFLNKEIKF
jgi:hypothetical protein